MIAGRKTTPANAETVVATSGISFFSLGHNTRELRNQLASTKGELSLVKAQYERASKTIQYSTQYGIPAGLAGKVLDASYREDIDPELAFRLVRLESDFNPHAISKAGAVGLTQLMPSTAVQYQKGVTRDQLFNPETNLRVGFRYLRKLLDLYKGNVHLALLAYNRGEDAVSADLQAGINPGNGYDKDVLRGYKGKGTID
ncbi:MAG TPA: lytic transglycosylase domain-containing protein [Gemmatimonadaceae bacterium]|nr:lytic transglycosylase domain-containing protein [Gemmatimonadaceae bacterium]